MRERVDLPLAQRAMERLGHKVLREDGHHIVFMNPEYPDRFVVGEIVDERYLDLGDFLITLDYEGENTEVFLAEIQS